MASQQSIVETVRLRVEAALARLALNGNGSQADRLAVAAEVRTSIVDARKLEGTI